MPTPHEPVANHTLPISSLSDVLSMEKADFVTSLPRIKIRPMKKLLVSTSLLLISAMAHTQTTTYTGTIKDLAGNPVTSGQVTFTLARSTDSTIPGVGRFVPTKNTCNINGDGTLSGFVSGIVSGSCNVKQNTTLSPSGTSYRICIQPNYQTPGSCFYDYAMTAIKDISTIVPTLPTGSVNYGGIPGPPGCVLGTTCTSALTPKSMNGVLFEELFVGADIGARIMAAIAALPLSTDSVHCGRIVIPSGTFTWTTPIVKPRCVKLEGASAYSTIMNWSPATGIALQIADPGSPNQYAEGEVADLTMKGPGSVTASPTAIFLGDIFPAMANWGDHQNFNRIRITGFGTAVQWGTNAWSTTLNESLLDGNFQALYFPVTTPLMNSGEGINVIGTRLQSSVGGALNIQGFADFYFYGGSCDYNPGGCGTISLGHFYGMHFEQTGGRILTIKGSSGSNVAIYGGTALFTGSTGTDPDMFYIDPAADPNSSFTIAGTEIIAAHPVTNLVSWNISGANAHLSISNLNDYGSSPVNVTNTSCTFANCNIMGVSNNLALNGENAAVSLSGAFTGKSFTTALGAGIGSAGGNIGHVYGFNALLRIDEVVGGTTPCFKSNADLNCKGNSLEATTISAANSITAPSIQAGAGVAITNTGAVPVTSATSPGGTCATPNGYISVVVNGATLHLATCP